MVKEENSPAGKISSSEAAINYATEHKGFSVQVRGKSCRHMPAERKISHSRWASDASRVASSKEESKPFLRRRVWSSSVKIRDKGRSMLTESPVQTLKLKNVISSATKMLQADSYEIEPWNIDDNDFNLLPIKP